MNTKGIVVLSGKMMSGKSTQAEMLEAIEDGGFTRAGLASALKEDIYRQLGEGFSFTDPNVKEACRQWMQGYGQAMRRLMGENYWCRRLLSGWWTQYDTVLVIDDVRFENEMRYLKLFAWVLGIPFCSFRFIFPDSYIGRSEVQSERYLARTGYEIDDNTRLDPSETSLDNYHDWDVFLNATTPPDYLHGLIQWSLHRRGFPGIEELAKEEEECQT